MTRRHCSTSRSWSSTAPGVQPGRSFDLTVTMWSEIGGRRKGREDAKKARERERERDQEQEQARYQSNMTSPHLAANFGS